MRTTLRSRLSLLFMSFALMLALPAMAFADELRDTLTGSATTQTITAGDPAGFTNFYHIQPTGFGNQCDVGTANDGNTVTFRINTPSGVTADKSTITFDRCKEGTTEFAQQVKFTSSTPNSSGYSITATKDSATGTGVTGQFDVNAATFTLKVNAAAPSDTTPPVISKDVTGTLGNNGWYTSNVTVDWTVSDSESPGSVQTTGCVDQSITADQAATTYSCSATSAGGSAAEQSVTIKRDATAPTNIQFVDGPAAGSSHPFGSVPAAPTCEADGALSGLASCNVTGHGTAVGSHTMTATATDNAGNQNTAPRSYTVTRANQAALTVTSPSSGTYGDHLTINTSGGTTNGALSYEASGTACQIDANNKLEITDGTGTCSVTATMAGNANYNDVTSQPQSVTVSKRAVQVTADAKSKTYGNADPALTYQITSGSLVNNDSFSGALTRASGETVAGSPYAIQSSLSLPTSKYTLSYVGADFTINPRPITVKADALSKFYGDSDPALTYQLAAGSTLGFTDTLGGILNGSITRAAGETVAGGPYAITQNTLAANSNYTMTFNGANFTINPAPITIKADNASRYYGEPNPAFSYSIVSGGFKFNDFANGDVSVNLSTTATASALANSTHDINVLLGGTKAGNYALTVVKGTLTISAWTNQGFFSPVDYGTTQNTVKNGSTVPLKFRVFQGTQQLTSTSIVGGLKPAVTNCATGVPIDDIEELATGGTSLRYDATAGQFIFNWQTPRKPGTCYNETVQMVDGTQIPVAKFWLK